MLRTGKTNPSRRTSTSGARLPKTRTKKGRKSLRVIYFAKFKINCADFDRDASRVLKNSSKRKIIFRHCTRIFQCNNTINVFVRYLSFQLYNALSIQKRLVYYNDE